MKRIGKGWFTSSNFQMCVDSEVYQRPSACEAAPAAQPVAAEDPHVQVQQGRPVRDVCHMSRRLPGGRAPASAALCTRYGHIYIVLLAAPPLSQEQNSQRGFSF